MSTEQVPPYLSILRFDPSDVEPDLPARVTTPSSRESAHVVLLDAAQVPSLIEQTEAFDLEAICLFGGSAASEFADAAPWLIRVGIDHPFLRNLFRRSDLDTHLWERCRFVLLRTDAPLASLAAHLRRFLRYVDWKPSPVERFGSDTMRGTLFRFYDAAILADWIVGTAHDPERIAALLAFDGSGSRLVEEAYLAAEPEKDELVVLDCLALQSAAFGPRPLDEDDRRALRDGADRRLVNRTALRLCDPFAKLDPARADRTRDHAEGALYWLRAQGGSPNEAEDVYQLALLAFVLGDAAGDVLAGPLMQERLVPVSERIALTRDSLFYELRRLTEDP